MDFFLSYYFSLDCDRIMMMWSCHCAGDASCASTICSRITVPPYVAFYRFPKLLMGFQSYLKVLSFKNRQKQKFIANRCVMYAQKQGMIATYIATIYGKWITGWVMLLSYRVFTIIMIFMLEIQRVQVNVLVYRSILRKLKSYESNCIVSYHIFWKSRWIFEVRCGGVGFGFGCF